MAYLRETWKIHKRQAQNMRRVNLEVYGRAVDALVATSYPRSLIFNFPLHVQEIGEPSVGNVMELGPFRLCCYAGRCMLLGSIFVFRWDIDELEDERSPGDNTTSTRKKVSTDNVLKDRGFTGRLRAYNHLGCTLAPCFPQIKGMAYDLGQIKTVVADGVENEILKLIDYAKQIFTERSHGICRQRPVYTL